MAEPKATPVWWEGGERRVSVVDKEPVFAFGVAWGIHQGDATYQAAALGEGGGSVKPFSTHGEHHGSQYPWINGNGPIHYHSNRLSLNSVC